MSSEENKELIRRYLEAGCGKPKPESMLRLFIDEKEPLLEHIRVCELAFPLYRMDVEEIIADSDLVSVRGMIRGTHLGEFAGIPATGKDVEFSIFITYRISNGKIVGHWMLTDNLSLMQQIGAVPAAT
jgi:predicted SnoaL-like aldol condensation-catalyzing enzyme